MCHSIWLTQVCLLSLLSVHSLPAQEVKSPAELYQDAVAADQSGDIEKAIKLYQQMLVVQPGSLEAHGNLGADLASTGRYDDAIAEYQKALNVDPRNSIVRLNLALARYKQAEYSKAAETLSALQKEQPANKQILYLLADCYLRMGRDPDVIRLLTPVYKADPNDKAMQYMLGTAYIHDGKIKQGQAVIDPILKNSNTPEANVLLGEVQFAAGDYKTAAATLKKALDLNPNLPGAWSVYGRALLQDNQNHANFRYDEASLLAYIVKITTSCFRAGCNGGNS